jgi:hypothetical protein
MDSTSKGIHHVHPFFQCVPHFLDHTSTLEQLMLCLRHHPLHVVPRRYAQPFLRLEEPHQLFFLQQIPCITHEDPLKVHDQIFKGLIVMHVSKGIVVLAYRYIRGIYKVLFVATAIHMKHVLHQQADEHPRTVRRLQKVFVIRQLREIPSVVRTHNPMKGLQILHPHRKAHQVEGHNFGQCQLLLRAPFVLPEVPKFLPERSIKKSLKKVINECKKNSEFFITHTQPPWIWYYLKLFLSYPYEVVNLSNF